MKQCTNTNNLYDNVDFCPGEVSLPGVRNHAYFIRKSDIVSWPKLPRNGAKTLEEVAVYTGNFGLAADTKWNKIDLVPNESEPKSEQAGSYGSYHFTNSISLVLPGTAEKVTGLITELNNDDVVILVPQRDGKVRVFGSEAFTVEVKPSQAWGKGSGDANTTTIEVTVEDMAATPFYPGEIDTNDGIIDGSTDNLKTTEGAGG
ncbi:MAG: hypothetical protein ACI3YG_09550 [Prevotella sp.]